MNTLEHYETAIARAEAAVAEKQGIVDDWAAKEFAMIAHNERLTARKVEIAESLKALDVAMTEAVGSGTKAPKNNAPDLHAEAVAVDEAIAAFPRKLANHREHAVVKDNGLHAARGALHQAQYDHAVFVYQTAMKDIWPLVDVVRQLAGPRADMTGMADSRGRFGKLPE